MNHEALKYAFDSIIERALNAQCKDLHHKQSERHPSDHICPVEYEIGRQAQVLRQHMKEMGLVK